MFQSFARPDKRRAPLPWSKSTAAHFAQAFRGATGRIPHRHVLERRVERAKELLAGSNSPLVEVALRVGFQNQSHFTVVFRRLKGATPGQYRKQARG